MHLCLHVYTCISLHLYLCVFMHMLIDTHMCLHTSLHEHTCMLHPCTYVYQCVCVYTQIYVYSHFCVCMCVCMCVHLHADFEPLLKKREHWSSRWLLAPTTQSMSHLAFGKRILQGYLPPICHTLPLGSIFCKAICHPSWPRSTEAVTVTSDLWSLQCLSGSDSSLGTSWLHRKIVGIQLEWDTVFKTVWFPHFFLTPSWY